MTDDEIIFDFLTVGEAEQAWKGQGSDEVEEKKEGSGAEEVPDFTVGKSGNKGRSMTFKADEDEFWEWWNREVAT
jgi:hypothetical protein